MCGCMGAGAKAGESWFWGGGRGVITPGEQRESESRRVARFFIFDLRAGVVLYVTALGTPRGHPRSLAGVSSELSL